MKLDKIINMIRTLNEEVMVSGGPANNASSGAIAGLPPDEPPVRKRKRESNPPAWQRCFHSFTKTIVVW